VNPSVVDVGATSVTANVPSSGMDGSNAAASFPASGSSDGRSFASEQQHRHSAGSTTPASRDTERVTNSPTERHMDSI
jgi:hypothetical protein